MNPFAGRSVAPPDDDLERFIVRIRDDYERRVFYLNAVRGLIHLMKGFVVETRDIGAERFKGVLDGLSERFTSTDQVKSLVRFFDRHKDIIIDFTAQQHRYLAEREQELRDIIDLLGRAMAALDNDNQSFHRKIYAQSEKIEQLTDLDDIRKIKTSLRQEVSSIQKLIAEKQQQDAAQMQRLNNQIDSLNSELVKVRNESLIDGLTGSYNRKALDAHLLQRVEADTVRAAPFALLLIDIDDFKRINDSYGHPVGDRVLVSIVDKFRQATRESDFLARYGGEEFAVILPGASLRNATKRARQICKVVASTRYRLSDAAIEDKLAVTVSIGVSVLHRGDTVSTIVERADQALYQAKRTGKNRTVSEKELTA